MSAKLYPAGPTENVSRIPVHPEVKKRMNAWIRIETLLENYEEKIKEFIRQLPNEKFKPFEQRKKYYLDTFLNITQDLVVAPVNTIFSQGYKLLFKNKEKSVIGKWAKNVTRSEKKTSIQQFMKDYVGPELRANGSVCTIVDKPNYDSKNKADELDNGMPYISNIRLQDLVTWQKDDKGDLEWIVFKKTNSVKWNDPFNNKQPKAIEYECLLTKWQLIKRAVGKRDVEVFDHNFGFVPMHIQASYKLKDSDTLGNAAMFQSSYSIINYNHNLNVAQYELNKHGGAVLLLPEDSITNKTLEHDKDGRPEIKKEDGSTMVYGGENPPEYLIKDLKVQEFLDMAETYKKAAEENERDLKSITKKGSTGKAIQESGFSKMLDRDPLVGNLNALSVDEEEWFTGITNIVAKMLKIDNDGTMEFDKDYNMKTLNDMYEEYVKGKSSEVEKITPLLMKEQLKNIAAKTVEDPKTLESIIKEIDKAVYEEPIDEDFAFDDKNKE